MKVGLSEDAELYKRNVRRPARGTGAKLSSRPAKKSQIARPKWPAQTRERSLLMDSPYAALARRNRKPGCDEV
ncbi:hypothetical protein [Paraburkholderia sp. 32]|uniref:hypothetical protein n=1 Tax=Paraburkholderia sp. 32 TaxID=2991057 RepID=UPI003D1EC4F7